MSYSQRIEQLRAGHDPEELLAYVASVFTGTEPSLALLGDGARKRRGPAGFLDHVMQAFAPSPMDDVLQAIWEESELGTPEAPGRLVPLWALQPPNAVRFTLKANSAEGVFMSFGRFEAQTQTYTPVLALTRPVISPTDHQADEALVSWFVEKRRQKLKLGEEKLDHRVLYEDLVRAVFARHLAQIVRALFEDAHFARAPKALPFYAHLVEREGTQTLWTQGLGVITESNVGRFDTAPLLLASQQQHARKAPRDRFDTLVRHITDPSSEAYAELMDLCHEQPESFQLLTERAHRVLRHGHSGLASVYSRAMWSLSAPYPAEVLAFQEALLDHDLPDLAQAAHAEKSPLLDVTVRVGHAHIDMLRTCLRHTPAPWQGYIHPRARHAWERLAAHPSPAIRIMGFEAALSDEELVKVGWSIFPARIHPNYVADLGLLLDELPEPHEPDSEGWDFVLGRLAYLGPKARPASARLRRLVERHEINARTTEERQLAQRLREVLERVGHESMREVVPAMSAAQTASPSRGEAHQSGFFATVRPSATSAPTPLWGAPRTQSVEKSWEALRQALLREPAAFERPESWEPFLDPTPEALRHFARGLSELGVWGRLEQAARRGPGPRLSALIAAIGEHADIEAFTAATLLSLVPDLPPAQARRVEAIQVAEFIRASASMGSDAEALAERIVQLIMRYPQNGVLRLLAAEALVDSGQLDLAMDSVLGSLRRLSEEQDGYLSLARAFFNAHGPDITATSEEIYPLFWLARHGFMAANYRDGAFLGDLEALSRDPFLDAMQLWQGEKRWEVASLLAHAREEWDFLSALVDVSEPQLLELLEMGAWPLARAIIQRLVSISGDAHAQAMVATFERFSEEPAQRQNLAALLWPVIPEALLRNGAFQRYLPRFVEEHPAPAVELTRQIITRLEGMGLFDVLVESAPRLAREAVVACFGHVLRAHFATQRFEDAEVLCRLLAANLPDTDPNWVLIQSNRAVVHIHANQFDIAEAVFADIFSRNYHREDPLEDAAHGERTARTRSASDTYMAMARYNYACLLANTDRQAHAVEALLQAVSQGHYTAAQILAEQDFAALHGRPDFVALVRRLP